MTTTNTWVNLPKWQQLLTIIVGGVWYFNQLDHPWLIELYSRLAMLAPLAPH
jgi:hypothetical protein